MIDLYFSTSPNVYKVVIALEEMALDYRLLPVDLSQGAHLDPAKVGGGVTGKVPVIVDHAPAGGGAPLTLFESGAILQYLAEKAGAFFGTGERGRYAVMQWLFWQMGGLGPIGGQLWHFRTFAPRIAPDFDNSYALNRYDHMFAQLWTTMDRALEGQDHLAGESYSIADMACFPWVTYLAPSQGMSAYPNVMQWHEAIRDRPAVRAAYARSAAVDTGYARNDKGVSRTPWEGILKHVITV